MMLLEALEGDSLLGEISFYNPMIYQTNCKLRIRFFMWSFRYLAASKPKCLAGCSCDGLQYLLMAGFSWLGESVSKVALLVN